MSKIAIHSFEQDKNVLTFQADNINVSLMNAIRRTIITDIPCYAFRTAPHDKNNVHIEINTSRLNNEIIKHRMSCIPVHITDLDETVTDRYVIEIDVENTTDSVIYVTTKDIKIKDVETGAYMDKVGVRKVFPPNPITGDYIIITRLRPKLSESFPGEHLKLSAKLVVTSAKEDSCFLMASTATYEMTPDKEKQDKAWRLYKNKLLNDGIKEEDMPFEEKNWYLHEGKRHYKENSFRFMLETIGVYENAELLHKACNILVDKLQKIYLDVQSGGLRIDTANTVEKAFDVILENEDYTIGKCLEYALYEQYYRKSRDIALVSFEKTHPLNSFGVLRIMFQNEEFGKEKVFEYVMNVCEYLVSIFEDFKGKITV